MVRTAFWVFFGATKWLQGLWCWIGMFAINHELFEWKCISQLHCWFWWASRTALLVCLLVCLDCAYAIEQPNNSVMLLHPRLYWVFKVIRKIAKIKVPTLNVFWFCFGIDIILMIFNINQNIIDPTKSVELFADEHLCKHLLRPIEWCSTWKISDRLRRSQLCC